MLVLLPPRDEESDFSGMGDMDMDALRELDGKDMQVQPRLSICGLSWCIDLWTFN